jgi:protein-S-isoprenylcysteine O-methyltransferase Ste14
MTMRSLELKIPPVVTFLLVGGLMWGVARAAPGFGLMLPARQPLAAVLALAGAAIAILAVISFRRARTTVHPLHPETASALVASGIFQLSRNPMYLGLLLILLGWAVFLASSPAFAFPVAFILLMNRLQIIPEEKALAAKFGAGFAAYRSKVRRWL